MNGVKIIIADTQFFIEDAEQILPQIAPRYVEKYHKNKIQKDAEQELVSGFLLKKYLEICRDEQLTYNEYEKPFLVSGNKFFNIAHSGDYVVLAIADCNVGIDVEKIRICHEPTVKKVFSTKQKEELGSLKGDAKDETFSKMWTECEARLKLKGIGFNEGWEKELEENCSIYTVRFDDYMITCATKEEVTIVTEKI